MDEKLEILLAANRIIASELDFRRLLEKIIDMAAKVVDAEAASLLLVDEKKQELYFDVATGEKGPAVKQVRLKFGQGIAGTCAKEAKPFLVNDVSKDARWAASVDKASGFATRSIIAVPLVIRGRVIGVVEAINSVSGEFGQQSVNLLEAFAAQAAVSIENARLFSDLAEEKEKLQAAFEGMSEAVLVTDPAGFILQANQSAQYFLGVPPREMAGRNIQELSAAQGLALKFDQQALAAMQERTMAYDASRRGPVSASGKPGAESCKPLVVLVSTTKLFDDRRLLRGYLTVMRDVTEERRQSVLQRSFLSLISHKLKTPLVTVLGYCPMLLEDDKLSMFQRKAITAIMVQGEKLAERVEKLIAFTTVEEENLQLHISDMDASGVVTEALEPLKQKWEGVMVEVSNLSSAPHIKADRQRVVEALRALLENAVKFNSRPASEKKVFISAGESDGMTRFSVVDNGPGIPPEELEKIFMKFYQSESSFTGQVEGAGLGLSLARRIAQAHGGKCWAESQIGIGSTLHITFPKP